jgi:hypothetical protein
MTHTPGTLPSAKHRPRVQKKRHANWISDAYSTVMSTVSRHHVAKPHHHPTAAHPARHAQPAHHEEEEEQHHIPGFLEYCWPAIFGILLAVISGHLREVVIRDWGEVGDRLVFPFVQLFGRPEFGFGEELSNTLPQLIQMIQFPIFGLYISFGMSRRHKLATLLVQVVFVSLIASFVLWFLSKPGASHGL